MRLQSLVGVAVKLILTMKTEEDEVSPKLKICCLHMVIIVYKPWIYCCVEVKCGYADQKTENASHMVEYFFRCY